MAKRKPIDVIAKAFYKWCLYLEKEPVNCPFLSSEEKDILGRLRNYGKDIVDPRQRPENDSEI